MDMSELAQKMLDWEQLKRQCDVMGADIERAVLDIGQTQTIGNVRVTYSPGRKSYDYEWAARKRDVHQSTIHVYSKTVIDWRSLCRGLAIQDVPFTQSDPTAKIKLIEGR